MQGVMNQVNMIPLKEANETPKTDLKEIYEGCDKELRVTLLNKFSELQEHTDRLLSEIRKTMYEPNEKFNKEIKSIKKTTTTQKS